ncbi:hypothetical protein BS17DRAFT_770008 [Gyrodon lividus]|nr:hypothetical protein BS17DRAFT_770008 [Gyrodon lividus]
MYYAHREYHSFDFGQRKTHSPWGIDVAENAHSAEDVNALQHHPATSRPSSMVWIYFTSPPIPNSRIYWIINRGGGPVLFLHDILLPDGSQLVSRGDDVKGDLRGIVPSPLENPPTTMNGEMFVEQMSIYIKPPTHVIEYKYFGKIWSRGDCYMTRQFFDTMARRW